MIFITVGTANKGFDRLIKKCDEIAQTHPVAFFAQIGSSAYIPKSFPYRDWLSAAEIQQKYEQATAFIIHGGFGTLSEVLALQKPTIVVPRTFDNGEAVNDQSDISVKLDKLGYVKCVKDIDELESVILNLNSLEFNAYKLVSDIPQIVYNQIELLKEKHHSKS